MTGLRMIMGAGYGQLDDQDVLCLGRCQRPYDTPQPTRLKY